MVETIVDLLVNFLIALFVELLSFVELFELELRLLNLDGVEVNELLANYLDALLLIIDFVMLADGLKAAHTNAPKASDAHMGLFVEVIVADAFFF